MYHPDALNVMNVDAGNRSVPRSVGAVALSALGLALAGIHGYHFPTGETGGLGRLVGTVIPMLLALALAASGPYLYRSRLDATAITTTVLWGYIGGVALGIISLLVVSHQFLKGISLHAPQHVVAATITGGALVGTAAGRYDALNRQKAALIGSLQEATAELSTATTTEAVCQHAVDIANEVLDLPIAGIWLHEGDEPALVPEAISDHAMPEFDATPTFRPGDSLSWGAFESGDVRRYDDVSTTTDVYNPDTMIRSEIIVPLGDLGVMNFGSPEPGRFDALDETVAELLGSATEAALLRADREERLRTQQQRLQQQNERLEEFTSIVSHDLRNPLSVARGRIELARDDGSIEHLDSAASALEDMESLIEDLLELARQGRAVGETEALSLATVAKDAWRNIDAGDATLEIEDVELDADRDRLRQLLENLLGNAVVHAGPDPTIRVRGLSDDDGFFVADDGSGIDPEDRDRIFEIGHTEHDSGTGFGLSIVRQIATAHGWSIRVTESTDGGARFEFITGGFEEAGTGE
jgi:signal transduction histidine kinase